MRMLFEITKRLDRHRAAMSNLDPIAVARAARLATVAMREMRFSGAITVAEIARLVEERRGRPLRVVELNALANDDVCGVWLVTEREDIVLHAPSESPLYIQQFVLHELAHMILGHDRLAAPPRAAQILLPDLPVSTVHRMLTRSRFDDEMEVEAEILADLLAGAIRSGEARSSFLRVFG
jgi:hypothetical protein